MSATRRTFVLWCVMLGAIGACDQSPHTDTEETHAQVPQATEPRTLEGGLVIFDVVLGTGQTARAQSTVEINFVAIFADGTEWDSSAKRQRSLSFALDSPGLIRGLRLGIEGMKTGGKRRLEIPWMLGYGETGRDPVPPKTDLVYEIELLRVTDPSPQDEAAPGK